MQVTKEDMERYGHKNDWGVDCLYLYDVQRMFADKLREAAEPLIADAVAFERKAGIRDA